GASAARAGPGSLLHAGVVAQEDLLERRLAGLERRDAGAGGRAEAPGAAPTVEAGDLPPVDREPLESLEAPQPLGRRRVGELDPDVVGADAGELIERADRRQVTVAHEPDAVADVLDLRQDVR